MIFDRVSRTLRLAITAALGLTAQGAYAAKVDPSYFETGNGFLEECSSGAEEQEECLIYLAGVLSGWRGALAYQGASPGAVVPTPAFCLPATVKMQQTLNAVLGFLRANPAQRDKPIAFLAPLALKQAYPCLK